ncbi:hypothetical protein B0H13DRAFT_2293014 [Mycena leptocephala]|nr:hypothetical protein B0H13DRAFT_2293014 [Mycena leptocephala]
MSILEFSLSSDDSAALPMHWNTHTVDIHPAYLQRPVIQIPRSISSRIDCFVGTSILAAHGQPRRNISARRDISCGARPQHTRSSVNTLHADIHPAHLVTQMHAHTFYNACGWIEGMHYPPASLERTYTDGARRIVHTLDPLLRAAASALSSPYHSPTTEKRAGRDEATESARDSYVFALASAHHEEDQKLGGGSVRAPPSLHPPPLSPICTRSPPTSSYPVESRAPPAPSHPDVRVLLPQRAGTVHLPASHAYAAHPRMVRVEICHADAEPGPPRAAPAHARPHRASSTPSPAHRAPPPKRKERRIKRRARAPVEGSGPLPSFVSPETAFARG